MIRNEKKNIIAVGRIHHVSKFIFQVRYFAIDKNYRRIGIGTYLMNNLEKIAISEKKTHIVLNARENVISFYESLGYSVFKKTNLLYERIQHYQMKKKLI